MFGYDWGMGWMGFMPILWIALIIAGIYFLVQQGRRAGSGHDTPIINEKKHEHCPNCGKQIEPVWKVCPYCKATLIRD